MKGLLLAGMAALGIGGLGSSPVTAGHPHHYHGDHGHHAYYAQPPTFIITLLRPPATILPLRRTVITPPIPLRW